MSCRAVLSSPSSVLRVLGVWAVFVLIFRGPCRVEIGVLACVFIDINQTKGFDSKRYENMEGANIPKQKHKKNVV